MRARKRYDDKFRASAVVMLEAAGYPDRKGALSQVGRNLGVPISTLRGWYNATRNPAPAELRNEKRMSLAEMLKAEINGALGEMPNARQDAGYRDLGTVAAILIDKLQLLEGKATERIEHISPEQRADRIRELFDIARDRRDQQAASH